MTVFFIFIFGVFPLFIHDITEGRQEVGERGGGMGSGRTEPKLKLTLPETEPRYMLEYCRFHFFEVLILHRASEQKMLTILPCDRQCI